MRVLNLGAGELEKIRAAWIAGYSLNKMSAMFNHGHEQICDLAERHGWPERRNREPLRAGHPVTWGIICHGSTLAGAAFPMIRTV